MATFSGLNHRDMPLTFPVTDFSEESEIDFFAFSGTQIYILVEEQKTA